MGGQEIPKMTTTRSGRRFGRGYGGSTGNVSATKGDPDNKRMGTSTEISNGRAKF